MAVALRFLRLLRFNGSQLRLLGLCGEIFCNRCTSYTQRLSLLAQRDPDGTLYKVCILCFNREGQSFGQIRNHLEIFKRIRSKHQLNQSIVMKETDSPDGYVTSSISNELERLTTKFEDHLNKNGMKSTVASFVKSSLVVPQWQIPNCGLKNSRICKLCTKKFTLLNTTHHCRICGEAVCLDCSNEELLLYVGDSSAERTAYWTLIHVTSCPREQPEVFECLRLCTSCHSHVLHLQLQNIMKEQQEGEQDVFKNVEKYYLQLSSLKIKISDVLKKYQELVNAIESEKDLRDILPKGESTTKVLAKYNSDTSDLFTQFAIDIQGFKRVRPKTSCQLQLVSSIINAMHSYYSCQFFSFRDLQRTLDNTLGHRALESVQIIVDYQTINCTFLALRQLGLECLELCHKHGLDSSTASLLATCEETCKEDLQKAVQLSGENWEEHQANIREFLKLRLKEKKFIVLSKSRKGTKYVEDVILRKCDLILIKVGRQLKAKARVNKFKQTKEALELTHSKIKELCKDVK